MAVKMAVFGQFLSWFFHTETTSFLYAALRFMVLPAAPDGGYALDCSPAGALARHGHHHVN
jgi:hypothetical protein